MPAVFKSLASLHEVKRVTHCTSFQRLPLFQIWHGPTFTSLSSSSKRLQFGIYSSLWNISKLPLFRNDVLEMWICSKFLVVLVFPWLHRTALFHWVLISFCIPQRNMAEHKDRVWFYTMLKKQGENKSTCHVATELLMASKRSCICPSANDIFMDNTLAF